MPLRKVSAEVEVSPWDSCERGHVYARTGYTKRGTCFECGLFRAHHRPLIRFFVLHKLKDLRGYMTLRDLAAYSEVPRSALSSYAYKGAAVPECRVIKIADALGVTEDDLKGIG